MASSALGEQNDGIERQHTMEEEQTNNVGKQTQGPDYYDEFRIPDLYVTK